MTRFTMFRPSVTILEHRWVPASTIYSIPLLNSEQASYEVQAAESSNPVVFLGDSITYNWGTASRQAPGTTVFDQYFAPLGAANFGIYGDNTNDVTQRVEAGDLVGKPKVAVLMIGVNNLIQGQTPLQAATGVVGVVQAIQEASPHTTILILGVLPSDQPTLNPKIEELDSLISVLGNHPGVLFENPGLQLLGTNGEAQSNLLIDGLHPDQSGYSLIAAAIDGTVVKLLQEADYEAIEPQPASSNSTVHAASIVAQTPVIPLVNASDDALIPLVTQTATPAGSITNPSGPTKSYATELINLSCD